MKIVWIGAALAAMSVVGCGTIVHGTKQSIGFASVPAGATVTVDYMRLGATPISTELKRETSHKVTIELPGYEKQVVNITSSVSGWAWGDIATGLLGLAVDAYTGGLYKLSPEQVVAEMEKSGRVASARDSFTIITVLKPDPSWTKVAQLSPMSSVDSKVQQ
jgi:hypothetical protein